MEVSAVFKKAFLLCAALLFAVCAHLRPCWVYEGLPPFTLRAVALAEETAQRAAEEILPGPAAASRLPRRLRFTLRRPAGDVRLLTDALLCATEGVVKRDRVCVGGETLGWVADGDSLLAALGASIEKKLPVWANGGRLSRELSIQRRYTREGYLTPTGDMLLLVTDAAPVVYTAAWNHAGAGPAAP